MSQKIVIVDDSFASRKLFALLLEKGGFEVRQAGDGEELRLVLQEFQPDLILMDFNLPGTGGLELTRILKASQATRGIMVVALTACTLASDVEKAAEAGCEGFIAKPIDRRSFVCRVKRYLELRQTAAREATLG
jgi:CheY-like chemotaxis protein